MQIRSALGFLAAAALLGGSAFAESPTFTDTALPTVVISDRLLAPGEQDALGNVGTQGTLAPTGFADFDPVSTSTSNLFRFSAAFSLVDYVDPGQGNTISVVQFLFNEFDDFADLTPNTNQTISINTLLAETTLVDETSFTASSPFVTDNGGVLDFRNVDLSPAGGSTPFPAPTGLPDSKVITLYVTDDARAAVDMASFEVVTRDDAFGDNTTQATSVFTPILDLDVFNNWNQNVVAPVAALPQDTTPLLFFGDSDTSGFSFVPSAAPTSGSPDTLTLLNNADTGFNSWQIATPASGGTAAVVSEQETIYRLRSILSSSNAATAAQQRIRWGSLPLINAGANQYFILPDSDFPLDTTPREFRTYLNTKAAGANIEFFYDLISVFAESDEITLHSIALDKTTWGDLGTGTVLVNNGVSSFTVDSEEVLSPQTSPAPTAFVYGDPPTLNQWGSSHHRNQTARPVNITEATPFAVTFPAQTASPQLIDFVSFGGSLVDGKFTASADKLYAVRAWVSTTSAADFAPQIRVIASAASGNPDTISQANEYTIELEDTPPAGTNNAGLNTSGAARAYTLLFTPQLPGGPTSALYNAQVFFGDGGPTTGTYNVERVEVIEFDIPE